MKEQQQKQELKKELEQKRELEMDMVLGNLVRATALIESCREFARLVPEVRVNLVYALPGAAGPADVAAIDGRLTRVGGWPRASGYPLFGASDHMARLIVEANRYDSSIRAGINFAWTAELLEWLVGKGMDPVEIDRSMEPPESAAGDGRSIPWKVATVAAARPSFPRLFFENPAPGKEPLFVLVGGSAMEVAMSACEIATGFIRQSAPW